MTHQVRHTLAETERLDAADKITVQNLEVVANAGLDAWGRKKTQRAFVTVTLALSKHFETAAKADALDNSTVHYGKLSKDIQAAVQAEKNWLSTFDFASRIEKRALETAGQTNIFSSEVNVFYPKGSLLGDGAGHARLAIDEEDGTFISPVLYLQNLRIPCIIGVNSNERLQKQSVVVNIWIEYVYHHEGLDDYTKLETVIVNTISDSSFETLESLSTMVVQHLREKFFTEKDDGAYIRLRVEKPLAVPFADAPAIEIFRRVKP